MSELKEILESISKHTSVEHKEQYRNLSIGRGELMMKGMRASQILWIVNSLPAPTHGIARDITGAAVTTCDSGKKDTYSELGSIAVPKNREFARILLQNYEGHHSCLFADRQKKDFLIKSSASYNNSYGSVTNIRVGVPGMDNWRLFGDLRMALYSLNRIEETIQEKKAREEEARWKAAELKKQQEREARKAEEAAIRAEEAAREAAEAEQARKAEEEARKAEEEARKAEEEIRKAEEEAEQLKEEIRKAQAEREAILTQASKAAAFIRKQVSLRRNPVLDKYQDSAKFSNLYNGVAEVISGGPGTGKTTTIIQRLKLLIDRDDLEDYIENHDNCKLRKDQLDIISSSSDNWIYFSPNDLLKNYLQDNMNYEGLTGTKQRTVVWKDFLKEAIRDGYHLAGQDCPFDFMGKKSDSTIIFKNNHMAVVENFTRFFLEQVKERFRKASKIDYSQFEWKVLGQILTKEFAKIDSVNSIDTLLRFLIRLDGIDEGLIINDKRVESASEITSNYNKQIRNLADRYAALLKRDEQRYNEAIEFIKSLAVTTQPEIEEGEEPEETEPDYGDLSIALYNKINPLLKKLSLQFKDNTAKLTPQQKQLYEIIKEVVDEDDLKKLCDSAYFVKYMNPALRGLTQYVLTPIPQYYRQYRRSMSDADKANWDSQALVEMLDTHKNKRLYFQEQSLLVGFINNIAKTIYKASKRVFENANHKYIQAYKDLCRPVIGVDEATDYSLIDFYGIKSFGHYEVCSYTLCGDLMQLMKQDGITNWNQLKHPLLFEKLEVKNLLMSYRQSKELLRLADLIYQEELKKKSPYQCYLEGEETPKPLWLESDDIDDKAQWISQRVMEITKTYGYVPTIAIFTIDKRKAEDLKEALDECENLEMAGIEVKVCSDNTLEGEKTLRIFPIDQVKGMEFEAVFFYDIDDIESTSLINKYLYVGLSRASMYLAVTSNGRSRKISKMLKKYFNADSTWDKVLKFIKKPFSGEKSTEW